MNLLPASFAPQMPRQNQSAKLRLELVRPLVESDLPAIRGMAPPEPSQTPQIKKIQHLHHRCARLVAEGRADVEVALLVGYTPQRVRDLKKDPTFLELVAYYAKGEEMAWKGSHERLQGVAMAALDELQSRLEDDPSKFTKSELLEIVQTLGVEPQAQADKAAAKMGLNVGPNVGGIQFEVRFVQSKDAGTPVEDRPEMIDVTPQRG